MVGTWKRDKLTSALVEERSSSEVTLGSSWPLHHILGTEQLSFGAYVSFELKNGHLRGKFVPVLGLRGRKADFFQEKTGNPLEKQTFCSSVAKSCCYVACFNNWPLPPGWVASI